MKKIINIIIISFLFTIFIGIFNNEVQASTKLTIFYEWSDTYTNGPSPRKDEENSWFRLSVYSEKVSKKVAFKISAFSVKDGKVDKDKNCARAFGNEPREIKEGKELGVKMPNGEYKITIEVEGEKHSFTTKTEKKGKKKETMTVKSDNVKGEDVNFGSKANTYIYRNQNKDLGELSEESLVEIYAQGDALIGKKGVTKEQEDKIKEIQEKIKKEVESSGGRIWRDRHGDLHIEVGEEEVVADSEEELLEDAINGDYQEEYNENIYQQPTKNEANGSAGDNLDDMISDADSFIKQGNSNDIYATTKLQDFSTTMFNIFSSVGAAVAIIVGIIIGIKYMTGSIEEKADVKKMLVPYLVGCIVVFGGFGIWKLVIIVLSQV